MAVVMRPVSGVIRKRASGSDWGSIENLEKRKLSGRGRVVWREEKVEERAGRRRKKERVKGKKQEADRASV